MYQKSFIIVKEELDDRADFFQPLRFTPNPASNQLE